MMDEPINPVCFGVMCELHANCRRYQTKDHLFHNIARIGFCDDERSMFLPITPIKGEASVTG